MRALHERQGRAPLVAVLLPVAAVFLLAAGSARSEVSVDVRDGRVVGLCLLEVGGGGGEPLPWPVLRGHVPAEWMLNPGGDDRTPPDGYPSLGWDPVGHRPEVAWSRHDGRDYEIVIATWAGTRWSEPVVLTANDVDDRDPELAYAPDGTARIVFHAEEQVFIVRRPPGGDWSAPELVDDGERPSVAGTTVERVAFQRTEDNGGGREIVVSRRDGGGGWIPEVVATTMFDGLNGDGDIDVRLHATPSGDVWVDWEDSAGALGWSELLPGGTWSAPAYEPLDGPGDEEAARLRIELLVVH